MIVVSERRKDRLMREANYSEDFEAPGAEDLWKIAGMVVLILFVVIFAGEVAA